MMSRQKIRHSRLCIEAVCRTALRRSQPRFDSRVRSRPKNFCKKLYVIKTRDQSLPTPMQFRLQGHGVDRGTRSSDNRRDTDEDTNKDEECPDTKPSKNTPPSFRFLRLGNDATRRTPNSARDHGKCNLLHQKPVLKISVKNYMSYEPNAIC